MTRPRRARLLVSVPAINAATIVSAAIDAFIFRLQRIFWLFVCAATRMVHVDRPIICRRLPGLSWNWRISHRSSVSVWTLAWGLSVDALGFRFRTTYVASMLGHTTLRVLVRRTLPWRGKNLVGHVGRLFQHNRP